MINFNLSFDQSRKPVARKVSNRVEETIASMGAVSDTQINWWCSEHHGTITSKTEDVR